MPPTPHRGSPRKLAHWESAVDRQIREAQERGDFDNLPGLGKPLSKEPWAGDWALAHHVLRQAGETLTWISLGRDIEAAELKLQRLRLDAASLPRSGDGWRQERSRARERYLREAAALDKLLQEYAFVVPSHQLERGRLPCHVAAAQFDAASPA
ncbi:MAG: DUF1992 domain-containing protein [Chloroflexota bacterium]